MASLIGNDIVMPNHLREFHEDHPFAIRIESVSDFVNNRGGKVGSKDIPGSPKVVDESIGRYRLLGTTELAKKEAVLISGLKECGIFDLWSSFQLPPFVVAVLLSPHVNHLTSSCFVGSFEEQMALYLSLRPLREKAYGLILCWAAKRRELTIVEKETHEKIHLREVVVSPALPSEKITWKLTEEERLDLFMSNLFSDATKNQIDGLLQVGRALGNRIFFWLLAVIKALQFRSYSCVAANSGDLREVVECFFASLLMQQVPSMHEVGEIKPPLKFDVAVYRFLCVSMHALKAVFQLHEAVRSPLPVLTADLMNGRLFHGLLAKARAAGGTPAFLPTLLPVEHQYYLEILMDTAESFSDFKVRARAANEPIGVTDVGVAPSGSEDASLWMQTVLRRKSNEPPSLISFRDPFGWQQREPIRVSEARWDNLRCEPIVEATAEALGIGAEVSLLRATAPPALGSRPMTLQSRAMKQSLLTYAKSIRKLGENKNFALDDFQAAGIQAIKQGFSVLVVAPTGAGKTYASLNFFRTDGAHNSYSLSGTVRLLCKQWKRCLPNTLRRE